MRPNIDVHDYDFKMRAIHRFLGDGDKVKVTMRFRGREMAHQEIGMQVLERVRDDLEELAKVEQTPKMEGRQMTMVMAPRVASDSGRTTTLPRLGPGRVFLCLSRGTRRTVGHVPVPLGRPPALAPASSRR